MIEKIPARLKKTPHFDTRTHTPKKKHNKNKHRNLCNERKKYPNKKRTRKLSRDKDVRYLLPNTPPQSFSFSTQGVFFLRVLSVK